MAEAPTIPSLLGYASPTPLAVVGEALRDGNTLVVRDGATLPAQCVLCGGAGYKRPVPLRFSWDTSFQIRREASSLQLRQKGTVHASFCATHRGRWSKGHQVGLAGMIASVIIIGLGMAIAAVSDGSLIPRWTPLGINLAIIGFALLILSLFVFALRTRTLECMKIEAGYLYLDGGAEAFLRRLPPLPLHARQPAPA